MYMFCIMKKKKVLYSEKIQFNGYHDSPKRIYKITETDFYGYQNGLQQTSVGTEMDLNRLQLIPTRTSMGTRKGRVGLGIPVMRYARAARPCALNFRLVALKCTFGRPPNAPSSVRVWPSMGPLSMPPLCASFTQNVITLTGSPIYRKKCGLSKQSPVFWSQIVPVIKQIKSNQQLMTLLIVHILDDTCEITCTRSRCSRHYLRSNNYRKMSCCDQRRNTCQYLASWLFSY